MALERITELPALAKRPADSNKGMYGNVLVVAGSRGMAVRNCVLSFASPSIT